MCMYGRFITSLHFDIYCRNVLHSLFMVSHYCFTFTLVSVSPHSIYIPDWIFIFHSLQPIFFNGLHNNGQHFLADQKKHLYGQKLDSQFVEWPHASICHAQWTASPSCACFLTRLKGCFWHLAILPVTPSRSAHARQEEKAGDLAIAALP